MIQIDIYVGHVYALWIENTSESYLPRYEATYAVAKRAQNKF